MKGLTLIELMISIAILTITLTVAVPGFGAFIERHQSNTTVSSLKRLLRHARILALKQEIPVTVCPIKQNRCINAWDAPIIAFTDLNNNAALDANETKYLTTEMDISTGYWQKKRINAPFVKFSPLGHAFSTATTFLYCPYSNRLNLARQLVINFQGRIRVGTYLQQNGNPYASIAPLACNTGE